MLSISPAAAARLPVARAATNGAVAGSGGFDYDLVIIGAGVGGHGAALHAVEEVGEACLVSLLEVFRIVCAGASVAGVCSRIF